MKKLHVLKWYRGYLISIFISSSEHHKCDTCNSFCTECIKLLTVFVKRKITPDSNESLRVSQLRKSAMILRFEQQFNICYIHVHVLYELFLRQMSFYDAFYLNFFYLLRFTMDK